MFDVPCSNCGADTANNMTADVVVFLKIGESVFRKLTSPCAYLNLMADKEETNNDRAR